MKNRRSALAGVAVAATITVVAGCGSSSSGGNSPGGSSPSAASPSAASSSSSGLGNFSGKSFTVLGQWTGEEQGAFENIVKGFDAATGAKVQYSAAAGGDEATVLGAKVNGGHPPDIATISLPGALAQYASAGKLVPVSSAGQQAVNANFASEWASLGSYKGKLYGVPIDAADKSTVWYNNTLFKNAGITSTPSTWPALINDAKTLGQSGVQVPISVGGGDGWTLTDWFENVYLRTAGLADYDKLTHHQIPWTSKTVTTALNTLKQIWGDPALIGSPQAALKVPFTGSVDNTYKAKPTSGLVYEASFVASTITGDKDPAQVGTTAKFFPFPSINGSKPVVEASGDFAVAFSHKPVVQAFLTYLAGAQAAKELVSFAGSGFLSANKNLAASDYPNSTLGQLGSQLVSVGNNFRFDMSDQAPATFGGTPNKGEWADLQAFLGNGNVAQAQQALEKDANSVSGWSG
ncbi:MAG TPA: extracellular solute-binding protein [Mycobacteriales bacterium]|jgi:ABC-type glycerol-3-phosphate transport system substrate-binding protein|nr:extracellular solute-binding protein [Mycobacteriales bacterium]